MPLIQKPPETFATVDGLHLRRDGRIWSVLLQAWLPVHLINPRDLNPAAESYARRLQTHSRARKETA